MTKSSFLKGILFFIVLMNVSTMNAQSNDLNKALNLNDQQQSIVEISALTAVGDLEHLKVSLNGGLNAGLTVNEVKEVLVQLYAYCGFPRSLNGISAFMAVVKERKGKGVVDQQGNAGTIADYATDKYEQGRKVLEVLTKTPQVKPAPGFGEFAPRIDAFLKEHLFADIFDSNVLTYQQRELATVSALAAMSGLEGQLSSHLKMAINTGLTEKQLSELFDIIGKTIGEQQAKNARATLTKAQSKKD